MSNPGGGKKDLSSELRARFPELQRLGEAAEGVPLYLVGGSVRELLSGHGRRDVDVAAEGDVAPIAHALGGEVVEHDRFATAKTKIGDLEIDLARARAETYA